jgi:hypothetical protein
VSREHDQRYGHRHRRLRAQLRELVESGHASCARCGKPIRPGEAWDLGHIDGNDPTAYAGPEHARCNRATAKREQVDLSQYVDDPERGIYWGDPGPDGKPLRWSAPWHRREWESEEEFERLFSEWERRRDEA